MSDLKLVMNCNEIDYRLAELLGERVSDFVVLYADGVKLNFFGTPLWSENSEDEYLGLCEMLNDHGKYWIDFLEGWKCRFIAQFDLATDVTAKDYRPKFSAVRSRSCCGYSKHDHLSVRLLGGLAASWSVNSDGDVLLVCKDGFRISKSGKGLEKGLAMNAAEAAVEFLERRDADE